MTWYKKHTEILQLPPMSIALEVEVIAAIAADVAVAESIVKTIWSIFGDNKRKTLQYMNP